MRSTTDLPETEPAGLWSLVGGELTAVAQWDVGPAIVLVPTEHVLLLVVDLPLAGAARRRAALPFAVEDRIAEPLDAVHIALGGALAPKTFLVGVVRDEVMAGWVARLADAGLDHARIVPDALALPVPAAGHWHVMGSGDRIVARTDTGIGLATPAERFAAIWAAGGSLPCVVSGAPLAVDLPLASDAAVPPDPAGLATSPLDLRTGPYAVPPRAMHRAVRRAAAVVALGLVAHTALLAIDVHAVGRAAAQHRTATAALLRATLPGTRSADLDRLLPASGHGALLPLLVRAAAALDSVGGLGWSKLGWSAADNRLTLGVEGGDIGALQRAQAALAAAGLDPASGEVTAGENRADGEFIVRGREA